MKTIMLTEKDKFPAVNQGDTLTISITKDDETTDFTAERPPYHIWVCPVKGGWLMRSTAPDLKSGPLFHVPHDRPMEAVSALIALMADDRL